MNIDVLNGSYFKEVNGEEREFNFSYYTDLRAATKVSFVNSVVDTLVTEKFYAGMLKDMIFDFMLIHYFTDIDVGDLLKMPNHLNVIEDFVNGTSIVSTIKSDMRPGLIDELYKAVDDNIAYRTGLHSSIVESSLAKLIVALENKVNEIDVDSILDLVEILKNMDGNFTPENIIDAYQKSDRFLANQAKREQIMAERNESIERDVINLAERIKKEQEKD